MLRIKLQNQSHSLLSTDFINDIKIYWYIQMWTKLALSLEITLLLVDTKEGYGTKMKVLDEVIVQNTTNVFL